MREPAKKTLQPRVRFKDRRDLGDGVQEFTIGAGIKARKVLVAGGLVSGGAGKRAEATSGAAIPALAKHADARWRDGIATGRAFSLGCLYPGRGYEEATENALKVSGAIIDLVGDGPHTPYSPGDFAIRLIGLDKKRAEALAAGDTAKAGTFERRFIETATEARSEFNDAKKRGRPAGAGWIRRDPTIFEEMDQRVGDGEEPTPAAKKIAASRGKGGEGDNAADSIVKAWRKKAAEIIAAAGKKSA